MQACVQALANTVAHVLHPDGAFLGCHSIRRTISIDPTTRLPVLDNDDAPFRAFQAALSARGFQWQMLHDSAGMFNCLASQDFIAIGPVLVSCC